ncbi:MAG: glutamate-cysteine ligase family protein [Caldilineaceae bacterium]|nr:glutamate-cysteine ligase family protein [Caldilineaceae bacterium]
MEPSLNRRYEALAATFAGHFPAQLSGLRRVGREAEFPIVDGSGRAADVARLWPLLQVARGDILKVKRDAVNSELVVGLDGSSYSYALEVGRGTIELNVGPCDTLFGLEALFRAGLARLVQAADLLGWRVLGYGVQPLTPATRALLSPKQRYAALADVMGDDWVWYTVTASDQLHVDVARGEAVAVLNFANLMAPVVVALCANSPVVAGALTGSCSSREARMVDAVHGQRHGMIARPYADLTDFVASLSGMRSLLRREGERLLPDGRLFDEVLGADYCAGDTLAPGCFEAFLLHDHYVWHSARLRSAYGTVELRPACQQPPHEAMAAAALYLGLVEGRAEITDYVQGALSPAGYWEGMMQYHRAAVRDGLAAVEPAAGFLAEVLTLAEKALVRRGQGEERMLAPLWGRLERGENPAQRLARVFGAEGVAGLVRVCGVGLE